MRAALVLPLLLIVPAAAQVLLDRNGIQFVSSTRIDGDAVKRGDYVVGAMLANAPQIRKRLESTGFKIEIIGKDQVISDLPDYADLKGKKTFDGRSFDSGTRGVGDKDKCSIGEENLLCLRKQNYPDEDILIHEFSHSVMANLEAKLLAEVEAAYRGAVARKLYSPGIYMMANSEEYWAEGTQAWFDATVRVDVNDGINSRAKLKAHDSALAGILERVYGLTSIPRAAGCVY